MDDSGTAALWVHGSSFEHGFHCYLFFAYRDWYHYFLFNNVYRHLRCNFKAFDGPKVGKIQCSSQLSLALPKLTSLSDGRCYAWYEPPLFVSTLTHQLPEQKSYALCRET